MKKLAIVLVLALSTSVFGNDMVLKAEIKMHQKTIIRLAKQNKDLKTRVKTLEEENTKLRKLLADNGIESPPKQALNTKPEADSKSTYLGKPITQTRHDQLYKMFCDKIAIVDGKPFDIGRAILTNRRMTANTSVGMLVARPHAKVLSVISDSEYLFMQPGTPAQYDSRGFLMGGGRPTLIFHVKGIKQELVDDQWFYAPILVCTGTYQYAATSGAKKTVASFVVYKSLTEEQFTKVLNDGFKLVKYQMVQKGRGKTKRKEIVGTPIKR